MSGQPENVRNLIDRLDAVGNVSLLSLHFILFF